MSCARSKTPELQITGQEPEFFVTHVAKTERAGDGTVRLYMAAERHDELRVEYTVVIPADRLARMCRVCAEVSQGTHVLIPLQDTSLAH